MDPAAITADSFSFINLFIRADWVVKLVMIGLILASIWSWTVIIDKSLRLARLNKQAGLFEEQVSSGRSLEDIAAEAGERPTQALPRMLQGALKEWRDARTRGILSESQVAFLVQRIDRTLDTTIARESARVENGLGSLAIVATASPFVGLFGTVWGIMHSFTAIAVSKNSSLAVVAPGIAEALFATAIGLFAAIPALMAYNKLQSEVARASSRLEAFADEFSAILSRQIDERLAA